MTDGQIADIYALAREAMAGGQSAIQLHSFPFRMTPENLARYRNDPHIGFWRTLKQGHDYFEETRTPVLTAACGGRYAFGVSECGGSKANPEVSSAVVARMQRDDAKVAELARTIRPTKRLYRDGDMHPDFKRTLVAEAGRPVGTTRNGVSRQDALAFTPVDAPLEQYKSLKAKVKNYSQMAELIQQEQLNAQMAADAGKTEPAKTEPAKAAEPAKPATPAGRGAPARAGTAVAQTPAAQQPAAGSAVALAPAQAQPQQSMFQRMLSGVGLGGGQDAAAAEPKVEEVAPHRVTVPLPPRRQAATPAPAAGRVSEIISDTQRLAPASAAGFTRLQ
jgi:hypothetical protein